MIKFSFYIFLFFANHLVVAQMNTVGKFQNHSDIGNPKNAGSARYEQATQTYYIKGSGSNIWFNRDEFQYLYNKISGDFILTANFEFVGEKAIPIGKSAG